MTLEITGKLLQKGETQQVSEKFKKREFVIEIAEEINGQTYTNFGKFQLTQAKCEVIDRFREGDMVCVKFNIKGNRWERDGKVNYITNLDAWRVEAAGQAQQGNQQQGGGYQPQQPTAAQQNAATRNFNNKPDFNPSPETIDDLPF